MKNFKVDKIVLNCCRNTLILIFIMIIFSPAAFADKNVLAAGIIFYNQGKYEKALSYLSKAVKDDPNDIKSMYYFANTLVKTYNLGYAEKYYRKIIEIQPYSEITELSKQALVDISDYKANIRTPHESLLVKDKQLYSSVNSYIQEIIDNGVIIHWQKDKMPLNVYISPSTYKEYEAFAWDAFEDWESSLGGLISFNKVDKEENAHLKIIWDKNFSNEIEYDLNGYTYPVIDGNELTKYNICIVERGMDGKILLPTSLYTYVLHQIGHALGVSSHSKNEKDIMFISGNEGKLTRRDVSTLHVLYGLKPDISNFNDTRVETLQQQPQNTENQVVPEENNKSDTGKQ